MSSLRPGTVDYSHFDNISVSDSESEGEEGDEEEDDDASSSEDSASSYERDAPVVPPQAARPRRTPLATVRAPPCRRVVPTGDLATLQKAWDTGKDTSSIQAPSAAVAKTRMTPTTWLLSRCVQLVRLRILPVDAAVVVSRGIAM